MDKKNFFILLTILFCYFCSESLLRRIVYDIPEGGSAEYKALVKKLPNFLQNYFNHRVKITELEEAIDSLKQAVRATR